MPASTMLSTGQPLLGEEERAAVDRVLRSGRLAQGPEVDQFEAEFAAHFQLERPCVAVNSGTSALHLGLLAAGLRTGDEVIVPSFTFPATANAVAMTGATPVFADIDPVTYCLDPSSVRAMITERTVAIMPVHLYGHPADMITLQEIAGQHGLQVFEDAAQAHGASLWGRPVGCHGSVAAFSFDPTKSMTAGEGGMVVVATAELERLVRLYRNQGTERAYQHEVVGLNNRMTELNAAIGRVQLTKIDAFNARRRRHAAFLSRHLENVIIPQAASGAVHVFHQYTVRVPDDRDGMAHALEVEHGIRCGRCYPVPAHRLAIFGSTADLPETDRAAEQCLSLPVHPGLTDADLERVVSAVNAVCRAGAAC